MLNKELLLAPAKEELAYTHIVTVGFARLNRGDYYGYDGDSFGDITPTTLEGIYEPQNIRGLYSISPRGKTKLDVGGDLLADFSALWLGRPDTKVAKQAYSGSEEFGEAFWRLELFTAEDIGKEIPIWLSYERPPWYNEHSGGVEN